MQKMVISLKPKPASAGIVVISLAVLIVVGLYALYASPAWSMNSLLENRTKQVSSVRTPADVASWLFNWDWSQFLEENISPHEGRFAEVERRPGFGPYNCSVEDIELQATKWKEMTSASETRWKIHCAGSSVALALHKSSPGRLGKVFVDIGANKGCVMTL